MYHKKLIFTMIFAFVVLFSLGNFTSVFAAGDQPKCPASSLQGGVEIHSEEAYKSIKIEKSGDEKVTFVRNIAQCNLSVDELVGRSLTDVFSVIVNVISGIVGFIAVVMVIIGGISYTTSSGDSSRVKKAKDTILYGIIGLIISLLAFAIVNFVLTSIFG